MPANYFPCYPFAHPFEEEVTLLLASELDERFLLIHNVVRPNRRRKSLFHKEIDLCILSRTATALFIEIKDYWNPNIDDQSIEGKAPNPVQEMNEYAKKFIADLDRFYERKLVTIPILIIRKKDTKYISPKWTSFCFEPIEFLNWIKEEVKVWVEKAGEASLSDLERIRENYLCCAKIQPFEGFDKRHFDLLRSSREYATQSRDEEFRETVLSPLYYQFRCMAYKIRSYLAQKGITVFQHVMSPEQPMPQPIYWVAFALRDVPNFLTEPQIAFHISSKDWYESGKFSEDHFSTKLAFFWSSKWMRKLLHRFKNNPTSFTKLVKETLADMGYRLVASRDSNDLFINTPVSSPNLQSELQKLEELVLKDGIKLRGIGFERPFYRQNNQTLLNKDELIKTVGYHFEILLVLLRKLLPEYHEEVEKTSYVQRPRRKLSKIIST